MRGERLAHSENEIDWRGMCTGMLRSERLTCVVSLLFTFAVRAWLALRYRVHGRESVGCSRLRFSAICGSRLACHAPQSRTAREAREPRERHIAVYTVAFGTSER